MCYVVLLKIFKYVCITDDNNKTHRTDLQDVRVVCMYVCNRMYVMSNDNINNFVV